MTHIVQKIKVKGQAVKKLRVKTAYDKWHNQNLLPSELTVGN